MANWWEKDKSVETTTNWWDQDQAVGQTFGQADLVTSTPAWESAKGPVGFLEGFTSNPEKFVPVFGSLMQATEMANIVAAAKRIENQQYDKAPAPFFSGGLVGIPGQWAPMPEAWSSEKQKEQDLELVVNWWNNIKEQQERGTTLGGKVGLIVGEMPAFMAEFALTGGLAKVGEKFTKEMVEKHIKGRLKKEVASKLLGKFGAAAVRTPAMMQQVAKAYTERRLPKQVNLNDGNLTFDWPKEKPFTSFVKAYGDVFTEAFSEELGEFIKLPFGKQLSEKLFKALKLKNKSLTQLQFLKRISTRTGFNGVLGEVGEEFVGNSLRAITNIQDFGAGEDANIFERLGNALQQDFENLVPMALAFAVPGAARAGIAAALVGTANLTGEPFSVEDVINRAKAQETIDQKMEEAKNGYINTKQREAPRIDRGPETQVLELEETVQPVREFPTTPETPSVVEQQVTPEITEGVQELIDAGMSPEKAYQWAKKIQEPAQEQPIDPYVLRQAEAESQRTGMPIEQSIELIQSLQETAAPEAQEVTTPEQIAEGRAEERIAREEAKKPQPEVAPTAKEKKPIASGKGQTRIEVIRRQEQAKEQDVLQAAKQMSEETGMPIADAVSFIQRLRGEQKNTAAPGSIIKTQLGRRNAAILRIAAGSKENFDQLMAYIESTGGLSEDPRLLNRQLEVFRQMASEKKRLDKKRTKAELRGKEVNLLNPFQTIRYAISKLEIASGFPLRAMYRMMNIKRNQTTAEVEALVRQAYDNIGETPERFGITNQDNESMKSWLFDGNQEAWDNMSTKAQALATEMRNLLQTEGARRVKSVRWKLWNKYGKVPAGIPKDKKPADILAAGRQAQAEGRLQEWLETQEWGARETYYMSEGFEDASDFLEGLLTGDTFKTTAAKPGVVPGEAQTRTASNTYKRGLVVNNVHTHLTRLALADELMDDLDLFWTGMLSANPSKADVSNMKDFVTHLVGRSIKARAHEHIARKARGLFWNIYFVDPFRSGYFFFRNNLQNMAYLPSQIGLNEARKSAQNIVSQWKNGTQDSERVEDFKSVWQNDINQKKKIFQESMLAYEEATPFERRNKNLVNMALRVAEFNSSWALSSDSSNRIMAWHTFYDAAKRNMRDFSDGKISDKVMRNRLRLDTLAPSQTNELLMEVGKGNIRNATVLYASYKTENTHFRYEATLRSAAEQTLGGRSVLGLIVFPRGVFNIAYHNGTLPLLRGLKTGDFDEAFQGLTSLLSLAVFSAITRKVLKSVTGKDSYGLPTYSIIDPGVAHIQNLAEIAANAQDNGITKTAKLLSSNLEFAIPMATSLVNMYESKNDKAGVKFWQVVLISLKGKYKNKYNKTWRKNNRSDWEKISHVLFSGGFELEEKD